MMITNNSIHVWHIALPSCEDAILNLSVLLSSEEIMRAGRMRNSQDRSRFITARGSLRKILGKYLDIPADAISFSYGKSGKPCLDGQSNRLDFNIAHCRNQCLIAVALDRQVGIDIEHAERCINWNALAELSLSEHEHLEIGRFAENERELAFLRAWTRKEAYTKAIGQGLSYGFSNITVSLSECFPKLIHDKGSNRVTADWELRNIKVNKPYFASVAIDKKGMQLTDHYL